MRRLLKDAHKTSSRDRMAPKRPTNGRKRGAGDESARTAERVKRETVMMGSMARQSARTGVATPAARIAPEEHCARRLERSPASKPEHVGGIP